MKAKSVGRRISGTKGVAGRRGKRTPLLDKSNKQCTTSDTEEVDDFAQQDVTMDNPASGDELDASVVAIKERKPQSSKVKASKRVHKGAKDSAHQNHETDRYESLDAAGTGLQPRTTGSKADHSKRQPSVESKQSSNIIQETQKSAVDMDEYVDEDVEVPNPKPIGHYIRVPRAAPQTRQTSVPRKRAGSASDTERNEPAIRRKLGDLTKKLENLDLKYRNVREIGVKEAERNFEKLKKQSEESQKGTFAGD
jgi:hypothetical protein